MTSLINGTLINCSNMITVTYNLYQSIILYVLYIPIYIFLTYRKLVNEIYFCLLGGSCLHYKLSNIVYHIHLLIYKKISRHLYTANHWRLVYQVDMILR